MNVPLSLLGGVGIDTCVSVYDLQTNIHIKPASRMVWIDGDLEASPGKWQILSCDR